MNFFIFGGSGFIGKHLVNEIRVNFPSSCIYNLDTVIEDHGGLSTYVYCDVRQPIRLKIQVASDDVIFNLAAIHRTPGHPSYDYFETNIRGAENVCCFAREFSIKRILFTSSIAPYGASEDLKSEETLPTPNTPYGISKLVAEKIHQTWQAEGIDHSLIVLRPGVVFGKGENGNFTRLYKSLKNSTFFYPGRKDTIKACIYVKDLVDFALQKIISAQEGVNQIYNCNYHPAYSIAEINAKICSVTKVPMPRLLINGRFLILVSSILGGIGGKKIGIHPERVKKLMISTNIDGSKIVQTGFKFKYGLEIGLKDWYLDNNKKSLE